MSYVYKEIQKQGHTTHFINLLEIFFFYLEEFYNQFSLRIINKLFWRGAITRLINVYRMILAGSNDPGKLK